MHFHVIPRFVREGPVALEGILSVKKMPEQTLDKIAETVKAGFSAPKAAAPLEEKPVKEEAGKKGKREEKKEEIDFDF